MVNYVTRSSNEGAKNTEVLTTCEVFCGGGSDNSNCCGVGYCCVDGFLYRRFEWSLQLGWYLLVYILGLLYLLWLLA